MDAKTGANIKTGKLTLGDKNWSFPLYEGTIGPSVMDVSKLYTEAGIFTYDPGFTSTGSCESKITYIDGDEGVLLYRGYPIEDLAEHGDFLETCYLLLYGELPTAAQKGDFDDRVVHHTMVHEQMSRFFQGFRRDAHPMAVMVGCVGALSAFYHDSTDITDPTQRMIASIRMIAKSPTLAAMAYKYSIGQPFVYPKNDLDYASNFLRMCFAVPCEEYKPNPVLARAMDRIFILHADHEQNASTSTVRLAGSTGANPFACIAAGIACLWGPAHGGANEAALKMLGEIGTVDRIPEYVKRAKDPNDSFRLMGFGHRVYKNYDPRAKIMQKTCHEVLGELGLERSAARRRHGARADRAPRRIFHREEALSECRLLLRHHAAGDGLPHRDVHGAVCGRAHRRLDRAVEGNDRGSAPETRPPAPALHRLAAARLPADLAAEVEASLSRRRTAAPADISLEMAERGPRERERPAALHEASALPGSHPPDLGDRDTGRLSRLPERGEFFRGDRRDDFIIVTAREHRLDQRRLDGDRRAYRVRKRHARNLDLGRHRRSATELAEIAGKPVGDIYGRRRVVQHRLGERAARLR